MDNRYRGSRNDQDRYDRDQNRDKYGSRQTEQFSSGSNWQQGDDGWSGRTTERSQSGDRWQSDSNCGYGRDDQTYQRNDFGGNAGYRSDTSSLDDYDRQGATRYGRRETTHNYFRGDDFGGQDYTRGSYGSGGSTGSYGSSYGRSNYGGGSIPPRQYDRDDRGFFDRASDEVMSWFGDDDAARRRQLDAREDHRGKGPSGYARSKERLLEDANERLMHDSSVDASNITVTCENDEITLNGTVTSRHAKRRAEDIVDNISGVKHVQNNLRVQTTGTGTNYYSETSTLSDS